MTIMRRSMDQRVNPQGYNTIPNKSLETLSVVDRTNRQTLVPKNDLEVAFSVSEVQILHENIELDDQSKAFMQKIGE